MTPRGHWKPPRIELLTATEQVIRLVRKDLPAGQAVVHVLNDVALPVRDPPAEAFMTRRLLRR